MLDILVVDDDDIVRKSLAKALTAAGHRVAEASDGEAALAMVEAQAFDGAICDVHLPKVDGLAVFRRLRRASAETAVVLMTSFARIEDAVAAIRDGALDYVTKPFDPDELVEALVAKIAGRQALRLDAPSPASSSRGTAAPASPRAEPARRVAVGAEGDGHDDPSFHARWNRLRSGLWPKAT